jgi:hypothetical protein
MNNGPASRWDIWIGDRVERKRNFLFSRTFYKIFPPYALKKRTKNFAGIKILEKILAKI